MKSNSKFSTSFLITLITIALLIISCDSGNKSNNIAQTLSQKIVLNKYTTIKAPKHWQVIPSSYDTVVSNTDTTYHVRAEGTNNCMVFSRTSRQISIDINRVAAYNIVYLDTKTRNTLRLLSTVVDTLNHSIVTKCLGRANGSQQLYYIENIVFIRNGVVTDLTIYSPNTTQYRDTINRMVATITSNNELLTLHQQE